MAAGRFDAEGRSSPAPLFAWNLAAIPRKDVPGVYDLQVGGLRRDVNYLVRGSAIAKADDPTYIFEVLPEADQIAVQVRTISGDPTPYGFVVEVSAFPSQISQTPVEPPAPDA